MLEIRNVTKVYKTGDFEQHALDDVTICFRRCEFASILGPSGSGKTTLLNIIGGLDHYTSGDLIINEISTKKFHDKNWDSYRNHRIGFIFQNYNLISHQTILSNVKLALTISDISKKEATERAKAALEAVGLGDHIHKKPKQLSGGQMQRVAIARALVNNPDIILADEPTGALDSTTSLQIMNILKEVSKTKLVIMVTHNPELAQQYSTRIIQLKDGKIVGDTMPYDGSENTAEEAEIAKQKRKNTKMSFKTALALSMNNLWTKKARTIFIALASSIGIIGIALVIAVSTGFSTYIDNAQEQTLMSYPLVIREKSTDILNMLLEATSGSGQNDGSNTLTESKTLSTMLKNISANDMKSFKQYILDHYDEVKDDLSDIKYVYEIEPTIYVNDVAGNIAKVNPSNLFNAFVGESSFMDNYSYLASVYTQLVNNTDIINDQFDILAGHLPEKYNEVLLVLAEPNVIPDITLYSIGLRDTTELNSMVTDVLAGKTVDVSTDNAKFTYDDIMNTELKLVMPTDLYKYNEEYGVYEDMSDDEEYMAEVYENAETIKISGIISVKAGVSTLAITPGIAYTAPLIEHVIDTTAKTDIVKQQLANPDIDVFSGNEFEDADTSLDLTFEDIVDVDVDKLQKALNVSIDASTIRAQAEAYGAEISAAITADTEPAKSVAIDYFNEFADELPSKFSGSFSLSYTEQVIDQYLDSKNYVFDNLENDYIIPASTFKDAYRGLLKGLMTAYYQTYISYYSGSAMMMRTTIYQPVKEAFLSNTTIDTSLNQLAAGMTEANMQKTILTTFSNFTTSLASKFANAFNVDEDSIIDAFTLKLSSDELTRIVSAMFTDTESTADSNLAALGYQDKDRPNRITLYFSSFDGKEHFQSFIDKYNEEVTAQGNEDKVINYVDTTGILMTVIKTIIEAVSYILIAFVSISLVVSSIMIGIITFISVYERTKEIGILRAVGASKHNVSSIFNAETFIIGLLSGVFGITIAYTLIFIANLILKAYFADLNIYAILEPLPALLLVALSIALTLLGGIIPAKAAAKKDPVEALKSD